MVSCQLFSRPRAYGARSGTPYGCEVWQARCAHGRPRGRGRFACERRRRRGRRHAAADGVLLRTHTLRRCAAQVRGGYEHRGQARHHANLLYMPGEQTRLPEAADRKEGRLEQTKLDGWRVTPLHRLLEEQRRLRAPAPRGRRRRESSAQGWQHLPPSRAQKEELGSREAVHPVWCGD